MSKDLQMPMVQTVTSPPGLFVVQPVNNANFDEGAWQPYTYLVNANGNYVVNSAGQFVVWLLAS